MIWKPNATVACIVSRGSEFLIVEERSHGKTVFNQPAGHIEENENIIDAAIRETQEETGWLVEPTGIVGIYTYKAPENGTTYYRFCLAASPVRQVSEQLDQDIIAAHWFSLQDLKERSPQLRSPLVMKGILDFSERKTMPLDFIYEHPRD